MFGVSMGPPYDAIAEKPTSSSTAYTTFGAPSGAFGGSKGDQSGTESRMSTLILPLNRWLITRSLEIRRRHRRAPRRIRPANRHAPRYRRAAHHPHQMISAREHVRQNP